MDVLPLTEQELNQAIKSSKKVTDNIRKTAKQSKKSLDRLHHKLYGCPMPEGSEEVAAFFSTSEHETADNLYQQQVARIEQQATRARTVYRLLAFIVPIALSMVIIGISFLLNPNQFSVGLGIGLALVLIGLFVALNRGTQQAVARFVIKYLIRRITEVSSEASKDLNAQYTYRQKLITQLCDERDRYFGLLSKQAESMRETLRLTNELLDMLKKRIEE